MAINIPNLPYQPAPTVEPQGKIPDLRIQATPDMFGAQVGQALTAFGATAEHGIDKLANAAMDMEKLRIETETNEAANKTLSEGGDLSEKFGTTMGENATKGYDAHRKALNDLNASVRAGLSSDYARKQYDSKIFSTMRQFQMRAAGHASGETKKLAVHSGEARINNINAEIEKTDPGTEGHSTLLDQHDQIVRDNAKITGDSPEMIENNIRVGRSQLYASTAKGMISRGEIEQAKAFLEQHKYDIDNKHLLPVQDKLSQKEVGFYAGQSANNMETNPKGTPNHPDTTPREGVQLNGLYPQLSQPYARWRADNPTLKSKLSGVDGDGRGFTFKTKDDEKNLPEVLKNWQEGHGLPVTAEVTKDGIHVRLGDAVDTSQPFPGKYMNPEERIKYGSDWAARQNETNINQGEYARREIMRRQSDKEVIERRKQHDYAERIWKEMLPHDGMDRVHNPQELIDRLNATDGTSQAWDLLDDDKKFRLAKAMASHAPPQSDMQEWAKFASMSDDQMRHTPITDILGNGKLSDAHQRQFAQRKFTIEKGGSTDATVSKAWRFASRLLNTDLFRGNPEAQQLFKAWVSEAVDLHASKNDGKMPDDEQLKKIVGEIAQDVSTPGMFGISWLGTKEPGFMKQAEPEDLERIRNDPRWIEMGNPNPTDLQVKRYWIREQLEKLQGERAAASKPAPIPGTGPSTGVPGVAPKVEAAPEPPARPVETGAYTGGRRAPTEEVEAAEAQRAARIRSIREAVGEAMKGEGLKPVAERERAKYEAGRAEREAETATQQAKLREDIASELKALDAQERQVRAGGPTERVLQGVLNRINRQRQSLNELKAKLEQ